MREIEVNVMSPWRQEYSPLCRCGQKGLEEMQHEQGLMKVRTRQVKRAGRGNLDGSSSSEKPMDVQVYVLCSCLGKEDQICLAKT